MSAFWKETPARDAEFVTLDMVEYDRLAALVVEHNNNKIRLEEARAKIKRQTKRLAQLESSWGSLRNSRDAAFVERDSARRVARALYVLLVAWESPQAWPVEIANAALAARRVLREEAKK